MDDLWLEESSPKIRDIYLEKELRKPHLPLNVSDGQAGGHIEFYSSIANKQNVIVYHIFVGACYPDSIAGEERLLRLFAHVTPQDTCQLLTNLA